MAGNIRGIVFHALLNPTENARLLSAARIGINPEDISQTPRNVFAFKTIECLTAGLHVITTPMGALEPELEAGITYMSDNSHDCCGDIAAGATKVRVQRATNSAANLWSRGGRVSTGRAFKHYHEADEKASNCLFCARSLRFASLSRYPERRLISDQRREPQYA